MELLKPFVKINCCLGVTTKKTIWSIILKDKIIVHTNIKIQKILSELLKKETKLI